MGFCTKANGFEQSYSKACGFFFGVWQHCRLLIKLIKSLEVLFYFFFQDLEIRQLSSNLRMRRRVLGPLIMPFI